MFRASLFDLIKRHAIVSSANSLIVESRPVGVPLIILMEKQTWSQD